MERKKKRGKKKKKKQKKGREKNEEKRHLCTRLQSVKEDQATAWHGAAPSHQPDLHPMAPSRSGSGTGSGARSPVLPRQPRDAAASRVGRGSCLNHDTAALDGKQR